MSIPKPTVFIVAVLAHDTGVSHVVISPRSGRNTEIGAHDAAVIRS